MIPPDYDCPLPNHVEAWRYVFAAATPQAIDRAIADMRSSIPPGKRRDLLRPASWRYMRARQGDLKTILSRGRARVWAEAEVRLRQYAADVTGDDETIESASLNIRLMPDGSLAVMFAPFATFHDADAIRRGFGLGVASPGEWSPGDFDPSARGSAH
jgi:hypothetical protein